MMGGNSSPHETARVCHCGTRTQKLAPQLATPLSWFGISIGHMKECGNIHKCGEKTGDANLRLYQYADCNSFFCCNTVCMPRNGCKLLVTFGACLTRAAESSARRSLSLSLSPAGRGPCNSHSVSKRLRHCAPIKSIAWSILYLFCYREGIALDAICGTVLRYMASWLFCL